VQKKRSLSLLVVVLAMLVAIGVANAQSTPTTFAGGWPYQQPPTGHFNVYATNNLNLGIYYDVMNPPLAIYHWASGDYEGELADKFGFDQDNNYVVTLKSGIKWSDGTPLTAQDLVTSFDILYMQSATEWKSLSKVEAVDDLTAKFTVTTPSKALERLIIAQENIAPTSVYGDLAKQVEPLIAAGKKAGDADFDALAKQIADFRPADFVADGPYKLDPTSITAQSLTLKKNAGGYNADVAKFDQILLWNGETETVTPLVAAGQLDYGTYGFPPATEQSFVDAGIDIIRGPGHTGPAIFVNFKDAPLDKVELRQAIAYVIDRDAAGSVSLGKSGVASEYMAGIGDSLVDAWVSDAVKAKLNHYDQDTDKASQLLTGIGYTKGSDGKWADASGNKLSFTLSFPSNYTDWSATAENVTDALNAFGFDITATGAVDTQVQQDVFAGNFQMAIQGWGASSPFPGNSYNVVYQTYDGTGLTVGQTGGGISFPTGVTYTGGSLDVLDATNKSLQGLDQDAQKALVDQLAQSFNELLPVIPVWERYANNPLNRKHLDAPASDDAIYQNPWSGTDAFMPYLIMSGKVSPVAAF